MTHSQLDIDRILEETFVARAEYHRTLTSTNDRAIECAGQGPGEAPLLIVAERQTAGRGRGTSRWWTGAGSLAFTLLLDAGRFEAGQPGQSPLVALASAVAVVDTLAPLLPASSIGIRWPNDVLVSGGKVAGILVEVLSAGRQAVGIGINTNNSLADAPAEMKRTATTLLELTGRQHDQTTLLVNVLRHLESVFGELGAEPDRIGARADQLCLQHDEMLALQLGNRTITGRCAGIAPDGALLLDTSEGRQSHYCGMLRQS